MADESTGTNAGSTGTQDGGGQNSPAQTSAGGPDEGVSPGPLLSNWREHIPAELATDASLADIKTFDDVVKGYVHAQKLVGKDKIMLPGEKATDADWDQVWSKLGRPEAPDKYELADLADAPEGFKVTPEFLQAFRESAHKSGLNTKQANALWGSIQGQAAENMKARMAEMEQARAAETDALKKEWGKAFQEKSELAGRVAAKFGVPELAEHPKYAKFLAAIGAMTAEDSAGAGKAAQILTPREALSQINSITGDMKGAYWDKTHPAHNETVSKVAQLFALAHPEPDNAA